MIANDSHKAALIGGLLFVAVQAAVYAQRVSAEEIPALMDRAVVIRCVSQIVEENQQIVWNTEITRVTIPGHPVGLRLVGSNLVVVVQFTAFLRPNGVLVLVAQGQTWINVPNEGMSYHATMQTIPMEFEEPVYFFPLGSAETPDEARIEIQIILEPYTGDPSILNTENAGGDRENTASP